jgi:hypothetical protein
MSGRTLALFISSSLIIAGCTVGSGTRDTESRQVGGFDEVVLMTSGDVNIQVTGTDSLTIEADDNILPLLTADVVDGRLELGSNGSFSTTGRITYTITAADLSGVTVAGSGNVDVSGISSDVFRASISGSGDINPSGTCQDLQVTISGSGGYKGADLEATTGTVTVSGSGEAKVNVTEVLNVEISGSGTVRYTGQPTVNQSITGSGDVSQG